MGLARERCARSFRFFRGGERISTGFVESAVNQVIDKRFDKRQSMRWTPRGAHLLLQTRTRVLNGDLDDLIRGRYPVFRMACAEDRCATITTVKNGFL